MSFPSSKSAISSVLQTYPSEWALTPVRAKSPYRRAWQTERPLTLDAIAQELLSGRAQGVGIRLGQISGGIVAIDFDGHSALDKWKEISGGTEPPKTVGWTSGRPGRWQLAFRVPQELWSEITSKKIQTAWDSDGKATEYLEIRWDGLQSVLPPSAHPTTAGYSWLPGQSPTDCEIALIPEYILDAAKPEPKYQMDQHHSPSNPTDNPWDIRNFAHLLDGYKLDGRRGWDTCKCPAHNGESDNSLHIEQITGAFKCHAGCDPKEVYRAALDLAKSRGYQLPIHRQTPHSFSGLLGFIPRLKKRFEQMRGRMPWGVGRKGSVEVEPTPAQQEVTKYNPGERLNVWTAANHLGYTHILDTSDTGLGKSFDAGRLTPEQFPDAKQIIYVSKEHRNPTTSTLKHGWSDLEARHNGLYRDEFGRLRRVDKDQPYVIPPNCGRNGTISALRAKNIPGADTAGIVCQTCPNYEPCKAGAVFGFLHERAITLQQTRFRAHPASLPSPEEFGHKQVVLVWEEAGEIVKSHRSIEVRVDDVRTAIADLAVKRPDIFDQLRSLLTALQPYLVGDKKQPNLYGWKDAQIRSALPNPVKQVVSNGNVSGILTLDVTAIREALKFDLDAFLDAGKEDGFSLADLPRWVRKKLSDSDRHTAERINRELPLNWLPDFLDVLVGNVVGSLRIQHGFLTITIGDDRQQRIADDAGCNIYLDATLTATDLARTLGISESEILVVQQRVQPSANLEIIQIATLGRLGLTQRSDYCQERVDALVAQIQSDNPGEGAVIDFKRHTKKGDGTRHWWVDSRGVNDLENCITLILVGTPCPNLGELEAEFTVVYGRSPVEGKDQVKYPLQVLGQPSPDLQPYFEVEVSADPDFREFCRRRILAAYHQAIGRLRAHRRSGDKLKIYILADYPLDFPVQLVKASQITLEAATKIERVEMAIRGAVQQLKDSGQKITQQAIAAVTGYSQQHISRFKSLLIFLLRDSNSKMSKNCEPPPDNPLTPDEVLWQGQTYFPLLANESPNDRLDGVLNTFEAYGADAFQSMWDATPADAQVKILQALMFTLSAGELRLLFTTVTVT